MAAGITPGWTGAWALLVPVLLAVVPAVTLPWGALTDAEQHERRDLGEADSRGRGRLVLQLLVVAVTAVLVVLIMTRRADGGADPMLLAVPVLLGGTGSILALRLLPLLLAAERGLPYAFASHFAPRLLHQAIDLYRRLYRPSAAWPEPYLAIGVPLIAAPTDEEAEFLASSTYQRVLGILTGARGLLQPPVENFAARLQPQERAAIGDFLAAAVIGGPDTVRSGLENLAEATGADEFMLVSDVYDPALRLRSLDIAAQAHAAMRPAGQTLPA